jgi:photosystem II stability/assembly factor-like uncharacterized protein/streptogramin lyase
MSSIYRYGWRPILALLALGLFAGCSLCEQTEAIDIAFIDNLHGWVSVHEPTQAIYRTFDGGKKWLRISVPGDFYRLRFFDLNVGFAICLEADGNTGVYRTTDSGQTWTRIGMIETSLIRHITDFVLTGPDSAFFVGEGSLGRGFVVQLVKGSHTLLERTNLPVDFSRQSNALGVFGDKQGHLWIVGKQFVLHSSDNGETWENQYPNTIPKIDMGMSGVAVVGGRAWFAAANWEIYRTEDYGKHWTRSLTTEDEGLINFESVAFYDAKHGCAVGNSSYLYCTPDGGLTWSSTIAFPNYSKGAPFFSKILLFNSSDGWACVGGALYRTSDGGRIFNEVLTSNGPVPSDVPGEYKALTFSVNGPGELASDGGNSLFVVEDMQGRLLQLNLNRDSIRQLVVATDKERNEQFAEPNAVAADREGNIFIVDFNGRIRELDVKTGQMKEFHPTTDQTNSPLEVPASVTVDEHGNLLIVDRHHRLFRWRPGAEKLEAIAGNGSAGFAGDGGLAINAKLSFPMGVAASRNGEIYVADYQNCRIRKIDARTQIIATVAGTGECASNGDGGPALSAAVDYPSSMVLDDGGNLFFVEGGIGRVRRIDASGRISTYAGTGTKGFSGDGGPADKASLINPSGLALDPEGNLYISDFVTNRVRRVDALTHIITTVAGNGKPARVDAIM